MHQKQEVDYIFNGPIPEFFRKYGWPVWYAFLSVPTLFATVFLRSVSCPIFYNIHLLSFVQERSPYGSCHVFVWLLLSIISTPWLYATLIFNRDHRVKKIVGFKDAAGAFFIGLILLSAVWILLFHESNYDLSNQKVGFLLNFFSNGYILSLFGPAVSMSIITASFIIFYSFFHSFLDEGGYI